MYLHSSGLRFGLEWGTNKWVCFGSCRFSQAPTEGYTAILYLGLGYTAIIYLELIFGALCSAWLHRSTLHLWGCNSIYVHQARQDCSSPSWTEEKTLLYHCILIKATSTRQDREWRPPSHTTLLGRIWCLNISSLFSHQRSANLVANIQREQQSWGCPGWSWVLLQLPTTRAGFVFLCLLTTISCSVQMSRSNKHSLGGWARQWKQSVTGTAWTRTLRALVPLQGRALPLLSCVGTFAKNHGYELGKHLGRSGIVLWHSGSPELVPAG